MKQAGRPVDIVDLDACRLASRRVSDALAMAATELMLPLVGVGLLLLLMGMGSASSTVPFCINQSLILPCLLYAGP